MKDEVIARLVAIALILAAAVWGVWYLRRDPNKAAPGTPRQAIRASYDGAKTGLSEIRAWATWLVPIETAILGALGLLVKECALPPFYRGFGFLATIAFGISISAAIWLLASIPSILLRLRSVNASDANDFFEQDLFTVGTPVRFGRLFGLQLTSLAVGLLTIAFAVAMAFAEPDFRAYCMAPSNSASAPST